MTSLFPALHQYTQPLPQRPLAELEQCDLCSEPVTADHRHLLELGSRTVRCACPACAILFASREASMGRYRLIHDRRLRLDGLAITDADWERLAIPVGLAFVTVNGETLAASAFYPSPIGAVDTALEPNVWLEWQRSHPVLRGMAADVEALLVNRIRGARHSFIVPIDDPFRLLAVVGCHWKGLSGGQELWKEIDRFFVQLVQRSVPVAAES